MRERVKYMAVIVVLTERENTVHLISEAIGDHHILHFCGRDGDCGAVQPDLLIYAGWDSFSELMDIQAALPTWLTVIPSAVLQICGDRCCLMPLCSTVPVSDLANGVEEILRNVLCEVRPGQLQQIQSELLRANDRSDSESGAMQVEYDSFASIYRFAEKQAARSGHDVQTLLLTLTPRLQKPMEPDHQQHAMSLLSTAIQMTLRKNDVLTGCSKSQMLVLLMDADDDGGHLAANRIVNTFLGMYEDADYELHYDIRPITAV